MHGAGLLSQCCFVRNFSVQKRCLLHYWNKGAFVEQFEKPEECDLLNVYLHIVQFLTSFHYKQMSVWI